MSYELLWRGKVVNARKGRLKNLLSALAIPAIAAAVYEQNSWFDGKPCIVLDYSKTSIVAHLVRDEIREIAPGVYLGLVFLGGAMSRTSPWTSTTSSDMRRGDLMPTHSASRPPRRKPTLVAPQGLFTFLVLRPLSDLFLWLWRLERRLEFLYRPQFDRRLRPPLFDFAQKLQNARREDEHLALAEERMLPGEEQYTQEIIDELTKFTRENWLPGGAQRFGNTKTFGVLRAEFMVPPGVPAGLRHGCRAADLSRVGALSGPARMRRRTSRTWASAPLGSR